MGDNSESAAQPREHRPHPAVLVGALLLLFWAIAVAPTVRAEPSA